MKRKICSNILNRSGFALPLLLLGLVTSAALVVIINSVFASRTVQTDELSSDHLDELAVPSSTITFPPAPDGWQTYTDDQLGFLIHYPESWYWIDPSKSPYFQRQCFSPTSDEPLAKPEFCVDMDPWVQTSSTKGFASNSYEAQQEFFESLVRKTTDELLLERDEYSAVAQSDYFGEAPSVELIKTNPPGIEATELYYSVSVYVNHPQVGLFRLAILANDRKQFEEYESIFRQIMRSFSLLE